MKKPIAAILLAGVLFPASAARASLVDRFTLKISPGGLITLGGRYNDSAKLREVAGLGAGLELGLRYELHENALFEFTFRENWLPVKQGMAPVFYRHSHPALVIPQFQFNGVFFLKSGYYVEPCLNFGVSLCPWRFSSSWLTGEPWPAPGAPENDLSGLSLGLHAGLGIEAFISPLFSLFGEVRYSYLFMRNTARFGTDDFTEQDFLGINLGIYLNLGSLRGKHEPKS